jgi:ribosome-associated heat shock protein Hsp15
MSQTDLISPHDGVRLDKWLWAARFFKTRSLAHAAIDGGKVFVDGVRAKASKIVTPGLTLEINSPRGPMTVVVVQVSEKRGSGAQAATLYRETDQSKQQREQSATRHRLAAQPAPKERPNTQDRRRLRRIKGGEF